MGQFLQGRNFICFVLFSSKVEPPRDQTRWENPILPIPICSTYVVDAKQNFYWTCGAIWKYPQPWNYCVVSISCSKSLFKVPKICNITFWIENDPPTLGTFPKNHLFCYRPPSLMKGEILRCFRILAKCGIRSAASLLWRRTCADDKNAKLHSPKFCSWRTFQHWTWIENGSHLFSALMYSVAEKTENIAAGFCNQEGASQMVAKSTLHLQEYIVKRNSG